MKWLKLNNICLPQDFIVNFAGEWSEDGKLCVLMNKSVQILNFLPRMKSTINILSFFSYQISLEDYYIGYNTGIDYKKTLFNASKPTVYHALTRNELTPVYRKSLPPSITPKIASWSQCPTSSEYTGCILAVLSNVGNLELFYTIGKEYNCLANITKHWQAHLKTTWTDCSMLTETEKMEIHENRHDEIFITSFDWSSIMVQEGKNYFYIIVSHWKTYISVWRINFFDKIEDKSTPILVKHFSTEFSNIVVLKILSVTDSSARIIIGNLNGNIKYIYLDFQCDTISKCVDIWSQNDVRVSKIVSFIINSTYDGIICIKGPYLIFSVLDSNDAIVSTQHMDLGTLNITGIEKLSDESFILVTMSGPVYLLIISSENGSYALMKKPINYEVNFQYKKFHGIVASPNKFIFGVLSYPCKMIDHLSMRQPANITFYIKSDLNLLDIFYQKPLSFLEGLEIMRCRTDALAELPCVLFPEVENYDNISIKDLRLRLWASLICDLFRCDKESPCYQQTTTLPRYSDLKNIFNFKYRLEKLSNLIEKYENTSDILYFDSLRMHLYYGSVKKFQKSNTYKKYFTDVTSKMINAVEEKFIQILLPHKPICLYCEKDLTGEKCSSKHIEQRCVISGVQIREIAKFECKLCFEIAHELVNREELFCPYCVQRMIRRLDC